MSLYHLCLLALAALGTGACTLGATRWQRVAAWSGLGAMALAMTGGLPGLILGAALMIGLAPTALRGAAPSLCLHRATSNLCMAGVLVALFLLNGSGICTSAALPLLTLDGRVALPMSQMAEIYLLLTVAGLTLYAVYGLTLCLKALWQKRPGHLAEIAPMTLATIGMGVGFG